MLAPVGRRINMDLNTYEAPKFVSICDDEKAESINQ